MQPYWSIRVLQSSWSKIQLFFCPVNSEDPRRVAAGTQHLARNATCLLTQCCYLMQGLNGQAVQESASKSVKVLRYQADRMGLPHQPILQYSWLEEGFKLRIILTFSEVIPSSKVSCSAVSLQSQREEYWHLQLFASGLSLCQPLKRWWVYHYRI